MIISPAIAMNLSELSPELLFMIFDRFKTDDSFGTYKSIYNGKFTYDRNIMALRALAHTSTLFSEFVEEYSSTSGGNWFCHGIINDREFRFGILVKAGHHKVGEYSKPGRTILYLCNTCKLITSKFENQDCDMCRLVKVYNATIKNYKFDHDKFPNAIINANDPRERHDLDDVFIEGVTIELGGMEMHAEFDVCGGLHINMGIKHYSIYVFVNKLSIEIYRPGFNLKKCICNENDCKETLAYRKGNNDAEPFERLDCTFFIEWYNHCRRFVLMRIIGNSLCEKSHKMSEQVITDTALNDFVDEY